MALDVTKAEAYYGEALELAPPRSPHRGSILARVGQALFAQGHVVDADKTYGDAIGELRLQGDTLQLGETLERHSTIVFELGELRH